MSIINNKICNAKQGIYFLNFVDLLQKNKKEKVVINHADWGEDKIENIWNVAKTIKKIG